MKISRFLLLVVCYAGLAEGCCTKVDCVVPDVQVGVKITSVPASALDSGVMLYAYDSSRPADRPVDSTPIGKTRIDSANGIVLVGIDTGVVDLYDYDRSHAMLYNTKYVFRVIIKSTNRIFTIDKFKYEKYHIPCNTCFLGDGSSRGIYLAGYHINGIYYSGKPPGINY